MHLSAKRPRPLRRQPACPTNGSRTRTRSVQNPGEKRRVFSWEAQLVGLKGKPEEINRFGALIFRHPQLDLQSHAQNVSKGIPLLDSRLAHLPWHGPKPEYDGP